MKLKISDLKTERQWRAATGFDQARLEKLLVLFTASYLNLYGKSVAERQADIEVTPGLTSEEEGSVAKKPDIRSYMLPQCWWLCCKK